MVAKRQTNHAWTNALAAEMTTRTAVISNGVSMKPRPSNNSTRRLSGNEKKKGIQDGTLNRSEAHSPHARIQRQRAVFRMNGFAFRIFVSSLILSP